MGRAPASLRRVGTKRRGWMQTGPARGLALPHPGLSARPAPRHPGQGRRTPRPAVVALMCGPSERGKKKRKVGNRGQQSSAAPAATVPSACGRRGRLSAAHSCALLTMLPTSQALSAPAESSVGHTPGPASCCRELLFLTRQYPCEWPGRPCLPASVLCSAHLPHNLLAQFIYGVLSGQGWARK